MKFSIIIPVYNVEAYLEKCLHSVFIQDYPDYEVIIVDDETQDNSMAIAEKFQLAHPEKTRIIHQKNKGLGGARNTGVQAASGDYLVFLDSDDYIQPHMLTQLAAKLSATPADIAIFNFHLVTTKGRMIAKRNVCPEEKICCTPEEKSPLLLSPPCAWNKVFKRSFYLNADVKFPEKLLYEDIITRYLIIKAENVLLCSDYLYCYVQREQSIMHSNVSPRTLDMIIATDYLLDRLRNEDVTAYATTIEASLIASLFAIAQNSYVRQNQNPYTRQLLEFATQKFPNFVSNPLLSQEHKSMINALLEGDNKTYHHHYRKHKLKEALLQNTLIRKLHTIRKGHNR